MADNYDLNFVWPYSDANDVIVTGTFDGWSSSVHLKRTAAGFEGSVAAPWNSKVLYKFVVDGNWIVLVSQPTEVDPIGNVNNVARTPGKPVSPQPNGFTEKEKVDEVIPSVSVPEEKSTSVPVPSELEETKDSLSEKVNNSSEISRIVSKAHYYMLNGRRKALFEVAPIVPIEIHPVVDVNTDSTPESHPGISIPEASTHVPAPATEPAAEAGLAPELVPDEVPESTCASVPPELEAKETKEETPAPASSKPSTPPPIKTNLAPSVPVSPAKTNGSPARGSTGGTSTPPSSTAPSTPKKQAFPGEMDSPSSSMRSKPDGARKKRISIFGKIKAAFSPDREKKKQERQSSLSPTRAKGAK
ncbi:hypothetical protein DFH11DRAFT_1874667 [Phellopilus nigrolimitatus]|nr:hypothetical protein DFH11DRAFT_1874667 [Phellopilus nigrolimitatus]